MIASPANGSAINSRAVINLGQTIYSEQDQVFGGEFGVALFEFSLSLLGTSKLTCLHNLSAVTMFTNSFRQMESI